MIDRNKYNKIKKKGGNAIPLKPFVEEVFEDSIKIKILPGTIYCPALSKSFSPLDKVTYFNCVAGDAIYIKIDYESNITISGGKAEKENLKSWICELEEFKKKTLFRLDSKLDSIKFDIEDLNKEIEIIDARKEIHLREERENFEIELKKIQLARQQELESEEPNQDVLDALDEEEKELREGHAENIKRINFEARADQEEIRNCPEDFDLEDDSNFYEPKYDPTLPEKTPYRDEEGNILYKLPPKVYRKEVKPAGETDKKCVKEEIEPSLDEYKLTLDGAYFDTICELNIFLEKIKKERSDMIQFFQRSLDYQIYKNTYYYIHGEQRPTIKNIEIIKEKINTDSKEFLDKNGGYKYFLLGLTEESEEQIIDENGQIKIEKKLSFTEGSDSEIPRVLDVSPKEYLDLFLNIYQDFEITKMDNNEDFLKCLYNEDNIYYYSKINVNLERRVS